MAGWLAGAGAGRATGRVAVSPDLWQPFGMEQATLFGDAGLVTGWAAAFDGWVAMRAQSESRARKEGPLSPASEAIYRDMWGALTAFCIARGIALAALDSDDLEQYLASRAATAPAAALPVARRARGRSAAPPALSALPRRPLRLRGRELSDRYAWRLLWLVDQVLVQVASQAGTPPNQAAARLLTTPRFRAAMSADRDPPPEYLQEREATALIAHLTALRRDDAAARAVSWKAVRDRAAVGLMLGAGLTPGDVRALTLDGVITAGGAQPGVPWKLSLPGNGNSPGRETPVASWAARLLALWLEVRAEQGIAGEFVFPATATGKPWAHQSCYQNCKAVLVDAGFPQDDAGGLFQLRHTFAMRQLARGKTETEVARWLGLQDETAMARYRRLVPWQVDVA